MKRPLALAIAVALSLIAGCSTTESQSDAVTSPHATGADDRTAHPAIDAAPGPQSVEERNVPSPVASEAEAKQQVAAQPPRALRSEASPVSDRRTSQPPWPSPSHRRAPTAGAAVHVDPDRKPMPTRRPNPIQRVAEQAGIDLLDRRGQRQLRQRAPHALGGSVCRRPMRWCREMTTTSISTKRRRRRAKALLREHGTRPAPWNAQRHCCFSGSGI